MKITESANYEEDIYQIELTDPVIGGADGIANLQAKQLANRTNWLNAALAKVIDGTTSIAKALKLATARKISLGGALSGSANFDGSADITIEASFANGVLTINSINGLSDALNGLANVKQPLDATLTALANLTTTANKLIYATGLDTFSTSDLTAFARTLLDDGDAATMKATLGIVDSFGMPVDVTANRSIGAGRVNTSGRTIGVTVTAEGASTGTYCSFNVVVAGVVERIVQVSEAQTSWNSFKNSAFFPVPKGASYSVNVNSGTVNLLKWVEY